MKTDLESDAHSAKSIFEPPTKFARSRKKLISLCRLLDELGWMIASEDPDQANSFQLSGQTLKRIGQGRISRAQLEKELGKLDNSAILHKTSHLVIWREPCKKTSQQSLLSKREREVYELLLSGQSLSEIARELGISQRTVEKHVDHIYKKHNVHSYNELLFRQK